MKTKSLMLRTMVYVPAVMMMFTTAKTLIVNSWGFAQRVVSERIKQRGEQRRMNDWMVDDLYIIDFCIL